MISSPTYYEYDRNKATFSFTANIKGRYYLSISIDDLWSHYIDYEYSISSPLILGFDPIVLIGLVITVAVVLTLVNGLLNLYLPRRRKNLFRRSIKCNLKQNMLRFTNEKVVKLEIIIFVVTVVVVLTFAFTGQSSYAGYQTIDWNNASRALTFDLQTGQTVTGSFSLAGNERTDYIIYNQDIGEIIVSQTSEHKGDFTFTAKTDGQYILRIHVENPFSEYMDYSYSISTPSILGVDRTVLTGIVITIGVVLALTIAVWDLRRTRMKKKTRKSIDKALPVQSIIKI
ncbi:hypothetical protein JXA31_04480 [Candidatus Bathyarchaeota archaeon]|nr:hypothetical protein [Candidatus Bathyarchaeota archaeon]